MSDEDQGSDVDANGVLLDVDSEHDATPAAAEETKMTKAKSEKSV